MIIFYTGSDVYRLRTAVAARITKMGAMPSRVSKIDAANEDERTEWERILKYPSFFQEQTVILVRSVFSNAETAQESLELLEKYTASALTDITMIVCREGSAGRESAATKILQTYLATHAAETETFEPLIGAELTRWIKEYCANQGSEIQPQASAILVRQIAGDTWALANELNKLCAYAGSEVITPETVRLLMTERHERDEFELSNALAASDKRTALSALWGSLRRGVSEQLLLGTLAHAVRTLLSVADLAQRHTPTPIIAKTIGLPPFVVSNALRGAQKYSIESLRRTHQALARLDRNAKNGLVVAEDTLFVQIMDM